MRGLLSACLSCFAVLIAASEVQANYQHCYPSELIVGGGEREQNLRLAYESTGLPYSLIPVGYRSGCALPNDFDERVIRQVVDDVGCRWGSERGLMMQESLAGASEFSGYYLRPSVREGREEFFDELCRLVAEIPWPESEEEFERMFGDNAVENDEPDYTDALNKVMAFERTLDDASD